MNFIFVLDGAFELCFMKRSSDSVKSCVMTGNKLFKYNQNRQVGGLM